MKQAVAERVPVERVDVPPAGLARTLRLSGPILLVGVAIVATLVSLAAGGAAEAPPLLDPGVLVLWGLPLAKLIVNLAVGVTLGCLLLVLVALSPDRAEFGRALDTAAGSAAVWAVASAVTGYLTAGSAFGSLPAPDQAGGEVLGRFFTQTEAGQAWLAMALAGAAITVLCFAARNRVILLGTAVLGVAALWRLSQEGHSGDSATHDIATTSIWLHMMFAGVWLGGLVAMVLLRGVFERGRLAVVLARYSTIALIAFLVVAISGFTNASLRVGTLEQLSTPYGLLVVAKIIALIALGCFGALHRRRLIRRIGEGSGGREFWFLVAAELAFMGVASGVATALARTATPVPDVGTGDLEDPTPAQILTDRPLPPELTPERWLTAWNPDLLWLLVTGFGIFFYAAGVLRLRRRGDRWAWHRTVLWVSGMLLLAWVTSGALNVYEQYLFSAHMLAHMLLSMAVPVLLVLAAPVTLAARAIRRRDDGSRGPREWILFAIHSRPAAVLSHPLVAAGIFAASLWVFYFSPLFRWATEDHLGHYWMVTHFLVTGYLFVQALVGIDPVPSRPPFPLRLLLLLAIMAMHAFFGLAILSSEGLLLADWYGAMGRTWGSPPLEDQQAGGGIAWSVGEIPTVSLAILVAVLWARSDQREARRSDRRADRDGDAELAAYNAMLADRGAAELGAADREAEDRRRAEDQRAGTQ